MVKFNNNLNNLFKNYQQQQKYAKKAFDVNGDGKVNSKDKKELDNKEKNLLKKSNLFDINGDGKFNQKDVDMFVKGDVNGNGKVTKEELNFISYYKADFKSAMTKAKADFTMDGKKYVKGKLANGLVGGKYYKDGKLFTGTTSDGTTYKNGVFQYSIQDNNGKGYPKVSGNTIICKNGSKGVKIIVNNGEKAVINNIGDIIITSKDEKTITMYEANGNRISTITDNNGKGLPNAYTNGIHFTKLTMGIGNGDIAVINPDGTVIITNKDGKNPKLYMSTGSLANGIVNGKMYKNGVLANAIINNIEYINGIKINSTVTKCLDGNIRAKSADGSTIRKYDKNGKLMYSLSKEDALKYLNSTTQIWINSNFSPTDITDRLFEDVDIVKTAEYTAAKAGKIGTTAYNNAYNASIKAQMISTPSNMKNVVGEVVEKSDGLYINDGSKLVKLNISAKTYLKLFPPIERYDVNQGIIGDCYFVSGCLVDMMKNPKAFSQLIQMFSENKNGDISIKFAGSLKEYSPVKFNKGELKVIDGKVNGNKVTKYTQANGSLGIKMLEQAYAISRFAQDSSQEISTIDIDAAIPTIEGGYQAGVYTDILDCDYKVEFISIHVVDKETVKRNKENIENLEPILIEYLEKKIGLEKAEEEFKSLDFVNDELYDLTTVIMMNYYYNYNGNIFEECSLNNNFDLEKFKTYVEKFSSWVEGTDKILDLTDAQLTELINKANQCDLYNLNFGNIQSEYMNFMWNTLQDDSLRQNIFYYYDNAFASDMLSYLENTLQTIKNNGLYNLILKDEESQIEKATKILDNIADKVNSKEILFSASTNGYNQEFNIVYNHAYSIEKIDSENKIVNVTNPWDGGVQIAIPYDIFITYFERIDYGYFKEKG